MELERLCAEEEGPVFVTKNGCARLVVMDIVYYEKAVQQLDEAQNICEGMEDFNAGKVLSEEAVLQRI